MKTILLVDDSPTMLTMERQLLGGQGYRLTTARDGLDALAKVRAERPDLIVMDVVMPRQDGFETCRLLRAQEATRTIPVLLVTTRSEAESVQRGQDAGCSGYLTKPIDGPELLQKIRALLGEGGGHG